MIFFKWHGKTQPEEFHLKCSANEASSFQKCSDSRNTAQGNTVGVRLYSLVLVIDFKQRSACVCVYVGRQSRGYAWLLEAKCHPVGSGRKGFAACVNHIVSNLLILKSASQN